MKAERFWAKTRRVGDCQIWTGARRTTGYGTVVMQGKWLLAHRAAFYFKAGRWPEASKVIRHTCDNKLCMTHIVEGTQAENMADKRGKHRNKGAVKRYRTLLELSSLGMRQTEIAKALGYASYQSVANALSAARKYASAQARPSP